MGRVAASAKHQILGDQWGRDTRPRLIINSFLPSGPSIFLPHARPGLSHEKRGVGAFTRRVLLDSAGSVNYQELVTYVINLRLQRFAAASA